MISPGNKNVKNITQLTHNVQTKLMVFGELAFFMLLAEGWIIVFTKHRNLCKYSSCREIRTRFALCCVLSMHVNFTNILYRCFSGIRAIMQKKQFTNPTIHLFQISQCSIQNRNVYISVLDEALWDMQQEHFGIFKIGLLLQCQWSNPDEYG